MPLGYAGRGAGIGMAKESTWGTAVSRTDWHQLISESLSRTIERPFAPHLGGSSEFVQKEVYLAGDDAGGEMEFEAVYNSICLGHVLFAALGACATSGPSGSEYTHTFALASTLPSFTIESLRGTGGAEVFEGMKCSSISLSIAQRATMRVRTSWIGQTTGGRVSKGTPTYTSTPRPILSSQVGTLGWNSATFAKVVSLDFVLDNRLERRNYLGSNQTTEPDFSGFRDITLRAQLHYDAETFVTGMTAGTSSNAAVSIAGTGDDDLDITLHNAIVTEASDPINGPGVIVQNVTLRARADSSNKGLSVVLKNNVAGSNYDW